MKLKIKKIAHHRNGICGEPFDIVLFADKQYRPMRNMMAIIFETKTCVAVLDTDLLAGGVIEFGQNSWRGDTYEADLRAIIDQYYESLRKSESEASDDGK